MHGGSVAGLWADLTIRQSRLAAGSSEIHWPAGHTPADADLFAHNELLIRAPCKRVWPHLVDAPTLARVVFELSEREAAQ